MSYKMIDLFAGCGGLEDGFLQSGKYEDIAAVEWLQPQVKTLINRLETNGHKGCEKSSYVFRYSTRR